MVVKSATKCVWLQLYRKVRSCARDNIHTLLHYTNVDSNYNEVVGERFIYLTCVTVVSDCAVDGECDSCCGSFNFEDKEFSVKRGDYAALMEKVSHYLQQAQVNPCFE